MRAAYVARIGVCGPIKLGCDETGCRQWGRLRRIWLTWKMQNRHTGMKFVTARPRVRREL